MLPRRNRQVALGFLALGLAVGLSACSDSGTPTASQPAKPVQTAAAKPAAPPAAPPPPTYVYETKGRRDPFKALIAPPQKVVDDKKPPKRLQPKPEELKVAGIIWGQRGFFALIEAPDGKGYVLRVNDVYGEYARVTKITRNAVTFEVKDVDLMPNQPAKVRLVERELRKEEPPLRKEE